MHGVYKTDQLTNWPIGMAFLREFEALDEARKCSKESLEMFENWGVVDVNRSFALLRMTRRVGICSGWHGREGGLVGWSVGQFLCTHLFVCGVMMKWCVCSDWLIEKKNKWWYAKKYILKYLWRRKMFCIFAMSSGRHTLHAASLQNTIINS